MKGGWPQMWDLLNSYHAELVVPQPTKEDCDG
jgi:hypothetical protein